MKIVVGVDGSEASSRALKWCADHAGLLQAEIVVVYAFEDPVYAIPPGMVMIGPLTEEQRTALRNTFEQEWCAPLRDAGVKFTPVLVEGPPALALRQVADKDAADLVVVGRRGRGGFAELLLGSTSHQLSHHIACPLLIVP